MPLVLFLFAMGAASAYTGRDISANIYLCGAIVVLALRHKSMPVTAQRLALIAAAGVLLYVIGGPSYIPPEGW